MTPLELWFDFGSTYSYVAAARVEAEAARAGAPVAYRPFLLGPTFQKVYGAADSPFNLQPARGRYMWRDLERLCARYRLPFRRPGAFPRNGLLAARVALAAAGEPWCGAFVRAVFDANFARDRDIADPAVVRELLAGVGQPASVIDAAQAEENKQRLKAQTARAAERGVFGAPTFFVGEEMFFGQDRLDDALAWWREHAA